MFGRENIYSTNYYSNDNNSADRNEMPKRIVSAPTLYCIFALGVTFVGIGTFLTAHSYIEHSEEGTSSTLIKVLKIVGPILLGIGVLNLLGMTLLCFLAYWCNSKELGTGFPSEEIYSIGPSTFYDGRRLINSANYYDSVEFMRGIGVDNVSSFSSENPDPVKNLAQSFANEKFRKKSQTLSPINEIHNDSDEIKQLSSSKGTDKKMRTQHNVDASVYELSDQSSKEESLRAISELNVRKLSVMNNREGYSNYDSPIDDTLRRSPGYEALLNELDTSPKEKYFLKAIPARDRSFSSSGPKPNFKTPKESSGQLRRHVTMTPEISQLRRKELRKRERHRHLTDSRIEREMNYPPELQFVDDAQINTANSKKKLNKNLNQCGSIIRKMPSYNIAGAHSLLDIEHDQHLRRSVSFETSDLNYSQDASYIADSYSQSHLQEQFSRNFPKFTNSPTFRRKISGTNQHMSSESLRGQNDICLNTEMTKDLHTKSYNQDLHKQIHSEKLRKLTPTNSEPDNHHFESDRDLGVHQVEKSVHFSSTPSTTTVSPIIRKNENKEARTSDNDVNMQINKHNRKRRVESQEKRLSKNLEVYSHNTGSSNEDSSSSYSSRGYSGGESDNTDNHPQPPSPTTANAVAFEIFANLSHESQTSNRTNKVLSIIQSSGQEDNDIESSCEDEQKI